MSVPVLQDAVSHEELMTSDFIRLAWKSDQGETIPAGAYIEYNGERYSILEPYQPARVNELSYEYKPEFHSRIAIWEKQPACIYTYEDDGVTVKSREFDWSFTGSPADAIYIILQAIRNETGETWTAKIADSLPATIELSSQTGSIQSVLSSIASQCETEYWVEKESNILHISRCEIGDMVELSVDGNVKVPATTANNEGYYTRFYPLGSTRNIVQDVRTSLSGVINKRLTLDPVKYPGGYKDIRGHFEDGVFVSDLNEKEVFSKTVVFDDIYPSADLVISDVRPRLKYRLDEAGKKIVAGGTDEEPVYEQYAVWYFKIAGFDFNKDNIIEGKALSVHFKTNQLAGRDFELIYYDKSVTEKTDSDVVEFTIDAGDYEIQFVEQNYTVIPGLAYIIPQDGDEVILYNIEMPAEYTQSAQGDLEESIDKYIADQTKDRNTYEFDSDAEAFYKSGIDLSLGRSVRYVNGANVIATRVLMVEKHLDFPCEQRIRIGNEIIKGRSQELRDEVNSLNQNVNVLAAFNDISQSIQDSYARTQAKVNEALAAYGEMFYWQEKGVTIGTKYNFFSEQENSAGGVGEAIGTSGGSGDVDLTGYATEEWVQSQGYALASDIPTKVSELDNDAQYVSKSQADGTYVIYTDEFVPLVERVEALEESAGNSNVDLTGYATEEWVQDQGYALDSDLSAVKDRVTALEATGGGTGGEIDLSAYATKTWVTEQGYATTSAIPTKVSQLTNDSNYITTTAADGKYAAYSDLKDYLKTTDIADWAKAASKPSYTYDEISGTPDLSIYALATDLANYLTTATASDTYVSKTSLTNTLASYLLKTDIADWAKASTKPTYKYSEIEERPDLSIYALASALADYALKTDVYTKTEVANLLKSYVSQTAFTQYQSEADERMTAVETNVSNNASEITALKTRVGSAESAINDNATNIRNNVGEIAALKTRMTTAEGNIKTNADGITELDKRVDTFEDWYNKVGQYFKYDETNEAWYVAGTFYATGENSAGGAGEELVDIASLDTRVGTLETKVNNLQFSINNLAIDFTALDALISLSGSIQSTEMDALGLTSDAVEGLLNAQYNKVIHSGTYRQVWNYSAYESSDVISIYFHQGDGFDVKSGYELSYNKSTGYWNILFGEI